MAAAILLGGVFAMIMTVILSRPRRGSARRFSFLSRYLLDPDRHPMAVVVLAGLAAASVSEFSGDLALVGALALVCAIPRRATWPFDLVAAVGSVALVGLVFVAPLCSGGSKVFFLVSMLVLAAALAVGVVLGHIFSGSKQFAFVLLFGLLDVVRFVSAPLGIALSPDDPVLRWVISCVGILALGALVGLAPRLVLPVIAIGITFAELWAAVAFPGVACGVSPGRVVGLVLFAVIYLVARGVRLRFA